MNPLNEPHLTPEQREEIFLLAKRAQEEADIISRIAKRSELVERVWKWVWAGIGAIVISTAFITGYGFKLDRMAEQIAAEQKRNDDRDTWFHEMQKDVQQIKLDLKDKVTRHE